MYFCGQMRVQVALQASVQLLLCPQIFDASNPLSGSLSIVVFLRASAMVTYSVDGVTYALYDLAA